MITKVQKYTNIVNVIIVQYLSEYKELIFKVKKSKGSIARWPVGGNNNQD